MTILTNRLSTFFLPVVAVFMLTGFISFEKAFAPDSDLWPRWQAHDPEAAQSINHQAWDQFIKTYVTQDETGLNRIDYGGITDGDRALLTKYLGDLSAIPISDYNRDEQFAYWLNLYNALTVQVILAHYPVDSILDISLGGGLFSSGPWSADLFEVEGEMVSLNDIEHRILRPIWNDPRIHYGVNCASIGCPNLLKSAFTGDTVNQALDMAARAFINNPRGIQVADDKVTASKIYLWFQEDFGDSEAGVLDHARQYAAPALLSKLDGRTSIDTFEYDWSLNDWKNSTKEPES